MLTLRQKLLFLPGQTSYLWICSDTFWTNKEEEASLNPGPKNEKERLQKVQEYLQLFDHQDSSLRRGKWTELEDMIYRAHKTAVKSSQTSYTDPGTGFKVFTGLFHYLRGYCCGCGCRHCPYQHVNAKDEVREKMVFNSAFYVPRVKKLSEE
uniref:Putative ribosomal protein n=1 Tax=Ixodes ricinus TaxID=34613 RepID=A0A0K8R9Q8_IXORI